MKVICPICKNEFNQNRIIQKYCSKKCTDKNWRMHHSKELIEASRKWDANHPERVKERNKKALDKFRTEKRDRFNELMRNVYQRNKEKYRVRCRHNKFLKDHPDLKEKLFSKCEICGSTDQVELHHLDYNEVILTSANVKALCKKCHENIHSQ